MESSCYSPKDLKKFQGVKEFGPELTEKFFDYDGSAFDKGVHVIFNEQWAVNQ